MIQTYAAGLKTAILLLYIIITSTSENFPVTSLYPVLINIWTAAHSKQYDYLKASNIYLIIKKEDHTYEIRKCKLLKSIQMGEQNKLNT